MYIYIYMYTYIIQTHLSSSSMGISEATSALKEVEASVASYEATLKVPTAAERRPLEMEEIGWA